MLIDKESATNLVTVIELIVEVVGRAEPRLRTLSDTAEAFEAWDKRRKELRSVQLQLREAWEACVETVGMLEAARDGLEMLTTNEVF